MGRTLKSNRISLLRRPSNSKTDLAEFMVVSFFHLTEMMEGDTFKGFQTFTAKVIHPFTPSPLHPFTTSPLHPSLRPFIASSLPSPPRPFFHSPLLFFVPSPRHPFTKSPGALCRARNWPNQFGQTNQMMISEKNTKIKSI